MAKTRVVIRRLMTPHCACCCTGMRKTVDAAEWIARRSGSFNSSVSRQTLVQRVRGAFDRKTYNAQATPIVFSKRYSRRLLETFSVNPKPLTQRKRCVRILPVQTHVPNEMQSCSECISCKHSRSEERRVGKECRSRW